MPSGHVLGDISAGAWQICLGDTVLTAIDVSGWRLGNPAERQGVAGVPRVGDTLVSPWECPCTGRHPGLLFRGGGTVHLGHWNPGSRTELHDDRDLCRAVRHGGEGRGCWLPAPLGHGRQYGCALSDGGQHPPTRRLAALTARHSCREGGHGALPTEWVAGCWHQAPWSPGGGDSAHSLQCMAMPTPCDTLARGTAWVPQAVLS